MKKTIKIIFLFIVCLLSVNTSVTNAGAVTNENCNTGVYSHLYSSTCDMCGFLAGSRLYYNYPTDFWDFLLNLDSKEKVFSSRSKTTITDYGNYLNEEGLSNSDLSLWSNWVPSNVGTKSAVLFLLQNLTLNSLPPSRSTPVGMIEYFLRGVVINSNGTSSFIPRDWRYLKGVESLVNNVWHLDATTYVSGGNGAKRYNASSLFEHTECYVLLPAWCGDGTIDSGHGEVCDDGNLISGDGCSNTCQIETSSPICGNTIIEAPEVCDDGNLINGDGCSNICQLEIVPVCGNAIIEAPEVCDDGNLINGDGCSNICQPEIVTSCNSLSASPASSSAGSLNSTLTCGGDNVSNYQIDCGNGQVFSGTGINSGTESFSNSCNYSTTGTYNSVCIIDGTITNSSCNATVNVSSGGGSNSPSCIGFKFENGSTNPVTNTIIPDLTKRNLTYAGSSAKISIPITCQGNGRSNYALVDCGEGSITGITPVGRLDFSKKHTFTCVYKNLPLLPLYFPKCYVGSSSNNVTSSSLSCGGKLVFGPGECGDGILQKPNSAGVNEQCDYGSANGNFINQCNTLKLDVKCESNCKISQTTCPYNGSVNLGPIDSIIIGDGINPFNSINTKPYIKNNSTFDLDIKELCVTHKSGNSLDGLFPQCARIGLLAPGLQKSFINYPNFIGNIDGIPSGSYDDNELFITVKDNDSNILRNPYFAADFDVRVSRPTVVTLGGGTSFINNSQGIANVKKVADEGRSNINVGKNDNFEGVGVSDDLSSSSKNLSDSNAIDKAVGEGNTKNDSINSVITSNGLNNGTPISDITQFVNFNGLENIFILKNKDFEIDNTNNNFGTGPRTYIIENGNLIINADINYIDNIAFVIKGGNLKINESVSKITGTYIVIPKNGIGGDVKGIGGKTTNVLTIVGSIHGNINDLIANRVYIFQDDSSGLLNVGTIVSFGSSVFRKPAPLTGQFIGEYIESQKIAQ